MIQENQLASSNEFESKQATTCSKGLGKQYFEILQ